jgi:Tfp pilus assembly protein PilV
MTSTRERPAARGQEGFALIEVLISAVIAVTITGAVIGLLNATGRASAEERHRSQAYAVAQEDQARLRAMRIPALKNLNQTRTVTLGGTPYTVTSTSSFVNDTSQGTPVCGTGTSSADYAKISSTVTWPSIRSRPPVVIQSIVSPASGSLDPTLGSIMVTATNAQGGPISGVGLSASGPGSFSGSTDSNGCALFSDQTAGDYTLTPTLGSGYVDVDGDPPAPQTVTVTAGNTTSYPLPQYDQGGSVKVSFQVRNYSGSVVGSTTDSIVAFNTGMTSAATFGTPGGSQVSSITASPLFPFTSPDSFYAGSCTTNDPGTGASEASVNVPAGGSTSTTIQLPALYVTVKNGYSAIKNANVTITDTQCKNGYKYVERDYTTNSSGQISDPGLPWGTYDICASAYVSSYTRHANSYGVDVHSTSGTSVNLSITSSTSHGSC